MASPKRNLEREAVICDLYREGKTLQEVGDVFGLTRERVRQILRRAGVPTEAGGARLRNAQQQAEARNG
jgi:DNA-directed RNA polymerase sigma subunit (sigma70/sigma32)